MNLTKDAPLVILAAPQHEVKNYCWDAWVEMVKGLTYPNLEVFLSDNSPTNKNTKLIKKAGFYAEWIKPKDKPQVQRMAESHEACRQHAIRKGAEYLFHLETDEFPQPDIIQELMMQKRKMVSGMYHVDEGPYSKLMIQQLVDGNNIELDLNEIDFITGECEPVFACGLGCSLIHRVVFEQFPFRYEKGKDLHPDTYFAFDLHSAGIQQYVHTGVYVRHNNSPAEHDE